MSQHQFVTTREGEPVKVVLGWDRPMGCFHLVVVQGSGEESSCLYTYLAERHAFDNDLEHYLDKLDELGIEVPLAMIEQVALDAMFNVGNRHVTYEADGSFCEAADCYCA